MSKVYLVTDGYYSDYHVLGVYATMEKAEQAKLLYAADNDIEEHELDAVPDSPPGLVPFVVTTTFSGDVRTIYRESADQFSPRWHVANWYGDSSDPCGRFYMWARDEQHAVRIANEWRAQNAAPGLWDIYKMCRVVQSYAETDLSKLYKESCQKPPEL